MKVKMVAFCTYMYICMFFMCIYTQVIIYVHICTLQRHHKLLSVLRKFHTHLLRAMALEESRLLHHNRMSTHLLQWLEVCTYSIVQYSTVGYSTVQYCRMVETSTIHSKVLHSTVYIAAQYSTRNTICSSKIENWIIRYIWCPMASTLLIGHRMQ